MGLAWGSNGQFMTAVTNRPRKHLRKLQDACAPIPDLWAPGSPGGTSATPLPARRLALLNHQPLRSATSHLHSCLPPGTLSQLLLLIPLTITSC